MLINVLRRLCVVLVSVSLTSTFIAPAAQAAMIGTDQAIAFESRGEYLDAVRAGLARDDVRSRLLSLGVDPADVEGRLAALTPAELQSLASRFEEAPAGGDALAIIGIVFLVLLLLEYTGTIDIFKKVP